MAKFNIIVPRTILSDQTIRQMIRQHDMNLYAEMTLPHSVIGEHRVVEGVLNDALREAYNLSSSWPTTDTTYATAFILEDTNGRFISPVAEVKVLV